MKVHIKEQPGTFGRFGAQWTPTFLVLDPDGQERRRFEGFTPADDLLAQLELALAHAHFAHERFAEAAAAFDRVVKDHPKTEGAAEALYWAGVARYKAGDPNALPETARAFKTQYPQSSWATKASVWSPEAARRT